MRLLWTKSKLPLSVLIRWGLKQESSHFLILFDDWLLFQSNLLGTNIGYFPQFMKHGGVELVHKIEVQLDEEVEEQVYRAVLDQMTGRRYDFGAFAYFMWRAFLHRVFRRPYPARNRWGSDESLLCVGVAKGLNVTGVPRALRDAVAAVPDLDMMTPDDLYAYLKPFLTAEAKFGIL